ncbi:MAG TPA: SDR family oxidoreductase [Gemmatimonadaceae bacterium]
MSSLPDPERRVALVTGGGRRVGRALAIGLARDGYRVAVHYNASREGAAEAVRDIHSTGGSAGAFGADLTDPEAPSALVRQVVATFGRLDVVVNSAAVMIRMPLGEVTAAAWDSVLDLNLRAPFLIAQEAARHISVGGSIVNIADLAAFETWPGYVPHGVSKAGLVYMTRALARVFAPGIRVNAVAPGTVLLPEWMDQDAATHLNSTTPLGRVGTPDDVLQAVRFLLEATYVTGETIIVDGGRHVRL